jgi:hypothetical protein
MSEETLDPEQQTEVGQGAGWKDVGPLQLCKAAPTEMGAGSRAAAPRRPCSSWCGIPARSSFPLPCPSLPPSHRQGDTKEGFYFGREVGPGDPEASLPLHGPNVWPPEALLPGFRAAAEAYFAAVSALGCRLVRLLALSLGLPPDFFEPSFDPPMVFLRPLRYSGRVSRPDEGIFGAGAHTDYVSGARWRRWHAEGGGRRASGGMHGGARLMDHAAPPPPLPCPQGMLTILATDNQPGLQVHLHGRWMDVPPVPGCFICNLGDMLER